MRARCGRARTAPVLTLGGLVRRRCRTVTVHVRRLRAKIEADASRPVYVRTVWGVGYKFEP
ncbi:MAG: winged helix-turn-helix domain-containing protein [Dehalococcoidia bacterium]|nr:winged helix-turn-helix domain-containing protein [Dehalococcoidia bacterium]